MKTAFYQITCLTELHMGSGENNFHIIDKTVERDPVTQYPMMNASGVKGALLEHFRRAGNPNTVTLFGAPARPDETDDQFDPRQSPHFVGKAPGPCRSCILR